MIVFVYLCLITIAIDSVILGSTVTPYYYALTVMTLAMAVVMIVYRRSRLTTLPTLEGWQLGQALDLSAAKPQVIDNAVITREAINLGILALGGPGSGKTESIALSLFYSFPDAFPGSGLAFFEGKGDIDIYRKACASGRKPDWFFSTELPGSDTINLMEGRALDVEDRLSRILIGETSSTSFYSDLQRSVLKFVIPVIKGLNQPVCLRDLYVLLTNADAQTEVLLRARASGIDPTMVSLFEQWLSTKAEKRHQELSGLLNRLMEYCAGETNDRINAYQPDISISEVVQNNQFVYFHLPLSEYSRSVAIAIVEMFGIEARRRQLSGPEQYQMFPLLLDDWGSFFHRNFGPISARCRSALMPLIFSFQSLAQIKSVSDNFARELDDNLATKIILRVNGEDTARFAINLLGEHKTLQVGTSQLGDREGTSLGLSRESLISARDLRQLSPGECFISTVINVEDRTHNPIWKLRIPRAQYSSADVAAVSMPTERQYSNSDGLNLWGKYMDPGSIAAFSMPLDEQPASETEFRVMEL